MAQTIPAIAFLPLYPSLQGTIGYRILNLDRTTATAFTTTNVVESPTGSGFYEVTNGISAPDLGGYIYWGISGTDYGAGEISPVAGGSSAPTVVQIRQEMDSNSTKLANLDATIASRAPSSTALSTAQWTNTRAGNLDNLDAAVSSRSTFAGGAVASVTGNVGGNVAGSVGSVTGGVTVTTNNDKTGYALSSAGIQAIWDALTSALTTVGSIGKRIADNLDAAVSSRLATAGYTTPPTVTAIRTEMDSNSTKLANLDVATSTRAAAATALSTAQWTNGRAANLDNLDATVSSRLATSGYTAPDNTTVSAINTKLGTPAGASVSADIATVAGYVDTEVAAIKAKTDNLPSDPASATNVTSAQTAITTAISALNDLSDSDIVTALQAMDIETGHSFLVVMRALYALFRNNSEADDPTNPTMADYYAPDGVTVRVHHDLTGTTRTVS